MRSVVIRSRRAGPGSVVTALFLSTACLSSEATDFYEAPSAIVGTGGSAGTTSEAGTSGDGGRAASGGSDASGASAGSSATSGSGSSSGTTGSGASAGGGAEGAVGGSAGEAPDGASGEPSSGGDPGAGGSAEVSCDTYAPKAEDFDGHCYLFVKTEVTWHEAVSACEMRGAHLVTISSEERTRAEFTAENEFVWTLGEGTPVWIGATDGKAALDPGDGTYYAWITNEPMTFDNWSASQPNNSGTACQDNHPCPCDAGACYEHCAFQWATEGKEASVPGWNDRLCEHFLAYVCEWDQP